MTPFSLTVLGPPALRSPDGEPVRFRTRKHLALLVFLAVERSIHHRRDRVASLLWPQVGMEAARHSLATGLSVLRARLGSGAFETRRDTVQLLPGHVITDLEPLDGSDPDTADFHRLAPFMEDFDLRDAPDFQIWCDAYRTRVLPKLQAILIARIDHCRRRGDADGMEHLADQLHRIDHLSEAAAHARFEARAMAGDRLGALTLFDGWRAELNEQLGATPTRHFEQIVARLRKDNIRYTRPPSPSTSVTHGDAEPPFVGRSQEVNICYACWERTLSHSPSHILIHGDSGIGKSALAWRVAKALSLESALSISVSCYPAETGISCSVLAALIDALLPLPGASATLPDSLATLSRIAPSVAATYSLPPSPPTRPSE
jgi:DNA-binding SARP family transcriptional activator